MKAMDKIRIIGYCGSGKTHIAKQLSKILDIPMYELDDFVWERRESGDRKFPESLRDKMLEDVVERDKWIIEGVQHTWTKNTFANADVIFVIDSNKWGNDWRMIKRYVKEKAGVEKANYAQSLRLLIKGVGWIHHYEMDEVMRAIEPYRHKCVTVRRSEDILDYVRAYRGIPAYNPEGRPT